MLEYKTRSGALLWPVGSFNSVSDIVLWAGADDAVAPPALSVQCHRGYPKTIARNSICVSSYPWLFVGHARFPSICRLFTYKRTRKLSIVSRFNGASCTLFRLLGLKSIPRDRHRLLCLHRAQICLLWLLILPSPNLRECCAVVIITLTTNVVVNNAALATLGLQLISVYKYQTEQSKAVGITSLSIQEVPIIQAWRTALLTGWWFRSNKRSNNISDDAIR